MMVMNKTMKKTMEKKTKKTKNMRKRRRKKKKKKERKNKKKEKEKKKKKIKMETEMKMKDKRKRKRKKKIPMMKGNCLYTIIATYVMRVAALCWVYFVIPSNVAMRLLPLFLE